MSFTSENRVRVNKFIMGQIKKAFKCAKNSSLEYFLWLGVDMCKRRENIYLYGSSWSKREG